MKKYLDLVTGNEFIVLPWNKKLQANIDENPDRFMELFEE